MAFIGRESFRIERVQAPQTQGAIPKAVSDTPTGRIFDRRRITRQAPAVEPGVVRSPRSLVALLVTTFAGGVLAAIAIVTLGGRVPAPARSAPIAPPQVVQPAAVAPQAVQPAAVAPPAQVAATPVAAPPVVAPPAPLDEPTPAALQPATPARRLRPDRGSREARPRARIVPPTRPWTDPFAG